MHKNELGILVTRMIQPIFCSLTICNSNAYPGNFRYKYVAWEDVTTRFCTVFDYQLAQMPDNAQFGTILETIQKYNDYRTFLEAIFADDEEQKP